MLSDNLRADSPVILSEAKNLRNSGTYAFEILRRMPQNDIIEQPLYLPLRKGDDFEMIPPSSPFAKGEGG